MRSKNCAQDAGILQKKKKERKRTAGIAYVGSFVEGIYRASDNLGKVLRLKRSFPSGPSRDGHS